ncbi:MAG: peptidylprolyl isomerase [Candidatus Cryptobacteroides sp.]
MKRFLTVIAGALLCVAAGAQKYSGLADKTVAVIGGEFVMLSDIEQEVRMMRARGYASDKAMRCDILEQILANKLILSQARVDSLVVNYESVNANLNDRISSLLTDLGGEEAVEEYFGKSVNRLREDWRKQLEEMSLTQQEQAEIAKGIPEVTPYDVKQYMDTTNAAKLPLIPAQYQMSQICIYPDREAAKLAAKEKLLEIRERIVAGEKFSTLARLYSQDPSNARTGGDLGMANKSSFWTSFSDAAMALKPGMVSNIVETPDGFHIIEMISKKGDMFHARHILIKPEYTSEDMEKAYAKLDSLKAEILAGNITFEQAARKYSEDPSTRTNGGQMADPNSGSSYFEVDQMKPADYKAIASLKEGEISEPFTSTDNEGRGAFTIDGGNLVYKIIRLDKTIPAHTATFDKDYDVLYKTVVVGKQNAAIDDFISRKIKETYIVIDPMFGDCEFSREGWSEKIRK